MVFYPADDDACGGLRIQVELIQKTQNLLPRSAVVRVQEATYPREPILAPHGLDRRRSRRRCRGQRLSLPGSGSGGRPALRRATAAPIPRPRDTSLAAGHGVRQQLLGLGVKAVFGLFRGITVARFDR